jgi:hypothetical protein
MALSLLVVAENTGPTVRRPADEDRGPGEGAEPGDGADSDGAGVVGGFADPGGLGPGFGDEQSADVAERDEQDAEVEQGAAQPQQPPSGGTVADIESGGPPSTAADEGPLLVARTVRARSWLMIFRLVAMSLRRTRSSMVTRSVTRLVGWW